ncbi:FecR domain-containing protein [Comamonas piscis]|uniref:FecR domain-containing protein n=2 Tax=Comamonas piscis TaxID=1562974 RepID=A0A7G5EP30_9BURK|nr:FecR domain-containing protein [Comamonas piscis]
MQAAEWFVRLQEEAGSAEAQADLALWRAQSPAHERAWQRAMAVSLQAGSIPASVGSPALARPQRRLTRRESVRALALLITAAPAVWLAWRMAPVQQWTASHSTATGERRSWTLADGSRLVLDTASAADVQFDAQQRRIHLRAGAIYVETAPDPQTSARPFIVTTEQGEVRALGTRFSLRCGDGYTDVAVQQDAVEVRVRGDAEPLRLQAGQQLRFGGSEAGPAQAAAPASSQWVQGVLAADNMRLDAFLAELSRYRKGWLRCDPQVAALRISGAFQLADTDAVLANLAQLLPVQISARTPYWITVLPLPH